jgi:hypothetical protein
MGNTASLDPVIPSWKANACNKRSIQIRVSQKRMCSSGGGK